GVRLEREPRARNPGRRDCANGTGPAGPRRDRVTLATVDVVPVERARGRGGGGPAPTRIVVAYGFWIFLLSDIVMFSGLFAAYAVLVHATAGGPAGAQLFNQVNVAIETACLLASSYTCGLMSLAVNSRRRVDTYFFA